MGAGTFQRQVGKTAAGHFPPSAAHFHTHSSDFGVSSWRLGALRSDLMQGGSGPAGRLVSVLQLHMFAHLGSEASTLFSSAQLTNMATPASPPPLRLMEGDSLTRAAACGDCVKVITELTSAATGLSRDVCLQQEQHSDAAAASGHKQ